jgi:hypothetical protein
LFTHKTTNSFANNFAYQFSNYAADASTHKCTYRTAESISIGATFNDAECFAKSVS